MRRICKNCEHYLHFKTQGYTNTFGVCSCPDRVPRDLPTKGSRARNFLTVGCYVGEELSCSHWEEKDEEEES